MIIFTVQAVDTVATAEVEEDTAVATRMATVAEADTMTVEDMEEAVTVVAVVVVVDMTIAVSFLSLQD